MFDFSPFQINNLMHQMRDSPQPLGGSVGSIPSTFIGRTSSSSGDLQTLQKALNAHGVHSTPASNLKFSESVRNAQHDGSPSIVSTRKMQTSRSYSHDLRSHIDSNSNLSISKSGNSSTNSSNNNLTMPDISPSSSQFFEVMYVGKIKVSHKRVPFSFIDDALPKFKAYDTQRIKLLQAQIAQQQVCKNWVNSISFSVCGTNCNEFGLQNSEGDDADHGQLNGFLRSNGGMSLSQRGSSSQLAPHEETHEEHEQDDDDNASKASNESKKSFNERVIDTKYENDRDDFCTPSKSQLLRRKSVAPALHSTLKE